VKRLTLPQSWRGRALVVADSEPDDAWFTAGELETAAGFRLDKRRREWKLSRMAAKQLALERGLAQSPHDVIVTRPPVLPFHVSISHSAPYAGAAIDDQPIGIDVQTVRELSESAAHLFLSDEEAEVMRACRARDRILHFWTAKEAAWKRLGGSIETLKRVAIRLEATDGDAMRFDVVETTRLGDVVIALTRPTS
jgi:phosphopantetheinyl transferase